MSGPDLAVAATRLGAPDFALGSVWLVGAGPGDPGLLTLHAAHALATADVVLHDALVSAEVLALASGVLEPVGKRAGGVRTPQLRINARLIALARAGRRVVRLKGGDPLLFGRGGEEAMALAAAAIPFRIVPGISAALGGTAAASIPLTHRTLARSLAFATGHDADGHLPPDLDLRADVLVFFMPLRQAGAIAAHLLAAGRTPGEAIAFISDATTRRQRVRMATLATMADAAAHVPAGAPTLLVVGPVLALRPLLAPLQQTGPMTALPAPQCAQRSR